MRINVRVAPKASRTAVKTENGVWKVYLTRPAVDGQANEQLIEVLARHLKVKKYNLEIIQGHNSRNKVVSVEDGSDNLRKK